MLRQSFFRSRWLMVWIGVSLFIGGAFIVVQGLNAPSEAGSTSKPEPSAHSVPATQTASDPQTSPSIPTVIIYATAYGFEPEKLTTRAGEKLVLIRNNTPLDGLAFTLARTGLTPSVITTLSNRAGQLSSGKLTLTPGEIVITEAKTPDWKCTLTVTP
jgi:hypothetical protein